MGVADNNTYKQQYHFNDRYYHPEWKDLTSINIDPDINISIKDNPYKANVEIEKDEIILKPDLTALFTAKGKKHSGGGIDVMLEPNTFVFSDDRSLIIDKHDHKKFEFKEPTKYKADKITPAEVLKRNVDLKHYNRLIANLQDPQKDDLAKKSSGMMLEKYIQTLGNIAYVQESKKDFPTGVPDFAMGTAPVYNKEVKDDVIEQKQYAKYGGSINPYMQAGGTYPGWLKPWKTAKTTEGKISPTGEVTTYPQDEAQLRADYDYWKQVAGRDFKDARDYQGFLYDYNLKQDPHSVGNMWSKWGQTNGAGDKPIINMDKVYPRGPITAEGIQPDVEFLSRADVRDNFLDKPAAPYLGARTMYLSGQRYNPEPSAQQVMPPAVPQRNPSNPYDPGLTPGDVTGGPQQPISADWEFTPWQKISQLYSAGKYASAKRYMPYRSRFNPSYSDPNLVNPEQAVGDMRGMANSQINSLDSLNPILRNAQAQSSYGQMLNQVPGVRSQYDNQNAQIKNQFALTNQQVRNNAEMVNMQNDQQYYQQSVIGRQNFDNMKSFLADQYMNNLLGDVQTNQTLAYELLTRNNPAYGFDFKTGNFYRNPKSILDVQDSSNTQENLIELAKQLRQQGFGDKLIGDIVKSKTFQTWNPSQRFKKGGRVNPYK